MIYGVLKRLEERDGATLGEFKLFGIEHPRFFTLEEPWKNNQRGISCIPPGDYVCKPHNWPLSSPPDSSMKFSKVYEVTGVTNRAAILFHAGNTVKDIEGCILLGFNQGRISSLPAVTDSKAAIAKLVSIIGRKAWQLKIIGVDGIDYGQRR